YLCRITLTDLLKSDRLLARNVMDEVFGNDNFVALINFRSMMPLASGEIESVYDYIVWYAKQKEELKYRNLWTPKTVGGSSEFVFADAPDGGYRRLTKDEISNIQQTLAKEKVFKRSNLSSSGYTPSCTFDLQFNGETFNPVQGKSWRTTMEGVNRLITANRIFKLGDKLYFKLYHSDFGFTSLENSWADTIAFQEKLYVVQTTTTVVKRCLLMTTDPGDLVFDPTCGSGTTAYVAEQWGRRWITCDTSRVALALARTRLMTARFPYYLLADSTDGIKKEAVLTGKVPPAYKTHDDIRKGFVYKRVPHVTLKSIANNPDIKEGMTRKQIDVAIARNADTETLYDQPYEDKKRVRVCGPFSVESLSPHRVLSTADDNQDGSVSEQEGHKQQDFATMIMENLKKAGVQNTRKSERLTFDRLDPYAGTWLHAAGEYTDAMSKTQRVAVSIGPEHGTVGPHQVKEAAKEAVQGMGFDMLIVCGFAFDPHVAEEVKRYGNLTVLPAKMNPDLVMGDELLKKTGTGNLFMIFGEPDVEIKRRKNGQVVVEINGVDVYDPTTGEIRSASTYDIACWFIDTNYNGESFFVRHAYFTGGQEPFSKLKRTLRAEIDEAAWSSLYSTVSRPFDKPETGKFAVKVINHYGDEVLKVFEIS
ncbi:MAG: DNA methyltransferase, partial [Candidatus Poribacteria bacterium]|nr:DNA methyltransferase [Candidatus Poribacteria bacterium]